MVRGDRRLAHLGRPAQRRRSAWRSSTSSARVYAPRGDEHARERDGRRRGRSVERASASASAMLVADAEHERHAPPHLRPRVERRTELGGADADHAGSTSSSGRSLFEMRSTGALASRSHSRRYGRSRSRTSQSTTTSFARGQPSAGATSSGSRRCAAGRRRRARRRARGRRRRTAPCRAAGTEASPAPRSGSRRGRSPGSIVQQSPERNRTSAPGSKPGALSAELRRRVRMEGVEPSWPKPPVSETGAYAWFRHIRK